MSEIAILSSQSSDIALITRLAEERGMRTQASHDPAVLTDLLTNRTFDVLFVATTWGLQEQQIFGALLWKRNPNAELISFDFSGKDDPAALRVKLFGADTLVGKNAETALVKQMDEISLRAPKVRDATHVLVVEDLDSPRDIICTFIEAKGFNVVGVSSADDALQLLQAEADKFGCIVSDLKMPRIDGTEFVKRVRRSPQISHIPIIMLTAYGSSDSLLGCLEAGASGFLLKPPRIADLQREIIRAFRIVTRGQNPAIIAGEDIDQVREALHQRGFT